MSEVIAQIAELEAKIQSLRSTQLAELQHELKAARKTVRDLESQIAAITGGVPIPVRSERRKRLVSSDIKSGILKALATTPTGMSQKEISEASGISYPTVAAFIKKNGSAFKTTGARRSKRFFLE